MCAHLLELGHGAVSDGEKRGPDWRVEVDRVPRGRVREVREPATGRLRAEARAARGIEREVEADGIGDGGCRR